LLSVFSFRRLAYPSDVILLIDNYDSFTWNLVQRLGEIDRSLELDRDLLVVRNDKIMPDEAERLDGGRGPSHVIISPGPCSPGEAGVSSAIIERFAGRVPVLGVCLGHQCIGALHGMTVARHAAPMHGKTSPISHDGLGIFAGLSNPFTATRYHSLVVLADTVPAPVRGQDGWTVSAWTDEDDGKGGRRRVVMGLRRQWTDAKKAPVEGVQFHPESFLTDEGPRLLANFLAMGARGRAPGSLSRAG
jgi:anthranilate synthase/aminodeoxychorismate synthase-like glutamine amidotransferase